MFVAENLKFSSSLLSFVFRFSCFVVFIVSWFFFVAVAFVVFDGDAHYTVCAYIKMGYGFVRIEKGYNIFEG